MEITNINPTLWLHMVYWPKNRTSKWSAVYELPPWFNWWLWLLDILGKAIEFAEHLTRKSTFENKLTQDWTYFNFLSKQNYSWFSVREQTSIDRLLMKCACGCLEKVVLFSKTAHLTPRKDHKGKAHTEAISYLILLYQKIYLFFLGTKSNSK